MDGAVVEALKEDDVLLADFDVEHLLAGFSDDLDASDLWAPICAPPPPECESANSTTSDPSPAGGGDSPPSSISISPYVSEIERFLLEEEEGEGEGEEDGEGFDDAFLAGFFADASDDVGSEGAAAGEENVEESAGSGDEKRGSADVVDVEGDDPISKKRRRQMRNRDSAMKSRERKKMYVKELEIKTRYLESECRRLSYALQCCTAENMALRHRLHAEGPLGAHVAVQESAVLFVESLLLGSLYWLVSIVCLFLTPALPGPKDPRTPGSPGRDLSQEAAVAGKISNEKLGFNLGSELVLMRRRCRSLKRRMKFSSLFPLRPISFHLV
ncbi:bZIP transcription factor 50 [Ananas comosus]|uniref:BZIP transcription factor 50 n=1 Tax=Ananas comosus TaxID=4615 RepID=A0A6P5GM58_ANACO|nr:bZIP transcription factor 50 [Ananas comosus]